MNTPTDTLGEGACVLPCCQVAHANGIDVELKMCRRYLGEDRLKGRFTTRFSALHWSFTATQNEFNK